MVDNRKYRMSASRCMACADAVQERVRTDNGVCVQQPECMVPGMAYVPMQSFSSLYEPEVGFDRGTVFRQLDLPYLGTAVQEGEAMLRG